MSNGLAIGWQVENSSGTPVSGAKIYTYVRNTSTAQPAYTDSAITVPASNPIIADAAGWFNVYLNPALDYTVVIKSADDSITYQTREYFGASATGSTGGNVYTVADTLSELAALTGDDSEDTVLMLGRNAAGDGGGGTFRWVTGNQSTNVTNDPGQGVWVAPTSASTGASGAWQRIYTGPLEAAWWGVVADATVSSEAWTGTDNTTVLNLAINYLRRKLVIDTTEGTNSLSMPPGFILVSSANFTALRGTNWAIYGNGCALVSKTAGKVIADFLHSWKGAIYDMAFIGDINTPPRRGVQQGYITSGAVSASTLHFINCYSVGYFSDCALYNGGSEEAKYNGPGQWENRQSTCTASIILDAYNEDGRFSDYQTGDLVAKTITGVTKANPGVVTCAGHGYTNGQVVKFGGVGGMTELNGNTYTVANATTDTFELSGTNTTGFTTFTSGGFVWRLVAYSFVNVNMVQSSAFSQLGGNGIVVRGGVQNIYFDGYTYSLDKAGLLIYTRNAIDTRRPNDLTFMAVVEGTNLKSCIEIVRGGVEVVLTGWKVSLNGIQPDDQIFLDDNTSNQTYLSGARIEIDTVSTTPTNGIFYPTTKWAGSGEIYLRPSSGLDGLPDFWNGRMGVVDGAEWGFPAGSYDIEMIKLTAAETTTLYRKGETRFVSTAAGTIADAGLAALGFTSITGSRVLSPFIGTEVSFTMADDSAKIIDLPGSTPACIVALACSSGSFANGVYWTRASGSPASVALTSGGTPATLSTGIKSGTTGADGVFHFSPHTDGNLYLENRSGASLVVSYTILSAV